MIGPGSDKNARKQTHIKIQFYNRKKVTSFDFWTFWPSAPISLSPTAHPFVCQHRFRDENCSDLNNSKFLICTTSCWHHTIDVGQTNNSRLMIRRERSLLIKNLSTWSNCSLSAISKVSTCKQFHFFQRGISSFDDIFHWRTRLP